MTQSHQPSPASSRKERILIISLIVLGLILVIFFGLRAFRSYMRIHQMGLQPGVTDVEAIRGWMTVPYISKAYGVPTDYLFEQLDIPQEGNRKKSLGELNYEYAYGEQKTIINAVKEAIRQYQANHPPPTEVDHD